MVCTPRLFNCQHIMNFICVVMVLVKLCLMYYYADVNSTLVTSQVVLSFTTEPMFIISTFCWIGIRVSITTICIFHYECCWYHHSCSCLCLLLHALSSVFQSSHHGCYLYTYMYTWLWTKWLLHWKLVATSVTSNPLNYCLILCVCVYVYHTFGLM